LIGQDLAYSSDGYSHSHNVEGVQKVEFDKKNRVFVKDYDGNDISSTYVWKNFLIQLEMYIQMSNSTCIDATEGGAKKEGAVIMNLKDSLDKYCRSDEKLPPLYTIVDKYRTNEELLVDNFERLQKLVIREIKWFELLGMRVEDCKEKVHDVLKKRDKYIRYDAGLNIIFDTVLYTENKFVKKTYKRPLYTMLFQTPVRETAYEVSQLGHNIKVLDGEILIKNVEVQKKLLKISALIIKRTLETLNEVRVIVEKDIEELGLKERGDKSGTQYTRSY
jgi:hypothetical protein